LRHRRLSTVISYRNPGDGPKQAREDRPNPRWPQDEEIEELVARARAIIAANPGALINVRSPVSAVVLDLLSDAADGDLLAPRVVEGVLADSASRHMLNGVGLHGGSSTRKRSAQA
jgi:hypothetical protein